jgi:cbb3-type cytochrome oxidase maturation protein
MEIIYLLIPLSLALVAVIVGFVIWAVKSGQFEDLDRPAHAILDDDDGIRRASAQPATKKTDRPNDP